MYNPNSDVQPDNRGGPNPHAPRQSIGRVVYNVSYPWDLKLLLFVLLYKDGVN